MKKLTEEWKIKKGKSKTNSFHESIDFAFSFKEECEPHTTKKQQPLQTPKTRSQIQKQFLYKSNASIKCKDGSFMCVRRSNRLKEKSVCMNSEASRQTQLRKCNLFNESCDKETKNPVPKAEMDYHMSNKAEVQELKQFNFYERNLTKALPKSNKGYLYEKHDCPNNENKNPKPPEVSVTKENSANQFSLSLTPSNVESNVTSEESGCCDLSNWGLPPPVVQAYRGRNISTMFRWQYECLCSKNVLDGGNLVYSAPTSAGKTLVAEILMLKKVIETRRKAMMILPFVSVVREKVNYLQEIFQDAGIIVNGYMGAHRPPGGFKSVDIAICTIEKANNLVNRLMEEKRLDEIGIVVVDELHMLGDNNRGYLLELLLTKLLYNCKRNNINIQVIGMSATLPNLNILATWLGAELYHTEFRPVPLYEMYKIGSIIYSSKTNQPFRELKELGISFPNDSDHSIYLAIESVSCGHSVLIFCPTKNWCEKLATNIAREIYNTGKPRTDVEVLMSSC